MLLRNLNAKFRARMLESSVYFQFKITTVDEDVPIETSDLIKT